eukprot:2100779-Rhodomonas_salina.1
MDSAEDTLPKKFLCFDGCLVNLKGKELEIQVRRRPCSSLRSSRSLRCDVCRAMCDVVCGESLSPPLSLSPSLSPSFSPSFSPSPALLRSSRCLLSSLLA